jgi:integrase
VSPPTRNGAPYWQARVTPHTFRHTWATWAAQRGVPLFEIAGMLGDTMKTVEKNYAHHHPDHLRGAVNSMPKIGAL